MKNSKIKYKALAVLAMAGLAATGAGSALAWGPERETFTLEEPATYPTFNSITNNPTMGDERNFVRVGELNADITHMTDEIEIRPGHQYLVYIYFHNNASTTFNDKEHNYSGVSLETQMASSFTKVLTPETKGTITATIKSKNAQPSAVWDEAYMTTSTEKVLLHYVPGSAKIYNNWATNGSILPENLFTAEGTLIGLNGLNGVIPGCEEFHGHVSYVIQADELGGSLDKSVSKDGENFGESVTLAPGEEATYRLTIANTGDVELTNVVIKDKLPAGLTLVPGSVQLTANESTTPSQLSDDIFGVGYNLGTIGTGNTVYITYKVKAGDDFDCEGTQLTNNATMTYDSDEADGETKTDSNTITVKRTDCEEPKEDLENCDTNPGLPECQTPEELPNTGPVEIAIAAVIIAGIGGGGFYFYRTQKALKAAQRGIVGGTGSESINAELVSGPQDESIVNPTPVDPAAQHVADRPEEMPKMHEDEPSEHADEA